MEKKVGIAERYDHELNEIAYLLKSLEQGRIYDHTNAKIDGSLSTNIKTLREMLNDLLAKIEYGKESTAERIVREFFIHQGEK